TWTRQHPGLEIDLERDALTDNGEDMYALLRGENRREVLFAGVHANQCVLDRPFGIRALLSWGFNVTLVRDFTDAMYDPAQPPYVDHEVGTELVIGYIENFLCPTAASADVLAGLTAATAAIQ
ncbi:MAG: isochorismatase, partial [Firmicutes bacterium]|nr:isochorismatase [Bacillota bacterium]